jgi:hypothetical protein
MRAPALPAVVTVDNHGELLSALAQMDSQPGQIEPDLTLMRDYEPFALCALLAQMDRWRATGRLETFIPPKSGSKIEAYIRHIGFYDKMGVGGGRGVGKSSAGTFPFATISNSTRPEPVALELAEIASKSAGSNDEIRKLLQYAIGEVLMNVKQHSQGEGYVMARYLNDGLFNIGVADNGIGIRQSFLESTSPILRGKESFTDAQWIDQSIRAHASSKKHLRGANGALSPNRGIGLTMCRALAKECLGHFMLISYTGNLCHSFKHMDYPESSDSRTIKGSYKGVLCSISFNPAAFGQTTFKQLRESVLDELGLGPTKFPVSTITSVTPVIIRMRELFHDGFLADGTAAATFATSTIIPIMDSGGAVSFDFTGIDNMTDSFSNACFAHLFERYPREFGARITFINCNSQIHSFILTAHAMSRHLD